MTRYNAGRRAEWRAQRLLEDLGYATIRSSGSHGLCDVVAWNGTSLRLIQVKRGVARLSPIEREQFAAMAAPACATKEYWRFPARCRTPLIEVL